MPQKRNSKLSDYMYGNDYLKQTLEMMNTPDSFMGIINQISLHTEERKKRERNEQAGIKKNEESGLYGVRKCENTIIPFAYEEINFKHGFYYCDYSVNTFYLIDVFNSNGVFQFNSFPNGYEYLGEKIHLVYKTPDPEKTQSSRYGALFAEGRYFITDFVLSSRMGTKFSNDSNFSLFGYKNNLEECVVDKTGKIVFEKESSCNYIYLHKNIATVGNVYYNLFTGEKICEGYKSISTKNLIFVEVYPKDQVFKIDTTTCEFEVFGEPEISPTIENLPKVDESVASNLKVSSEPPKPPKLNRNDVCSCGSNKKFKNCCKKGQF